MTINSPVAPIPPSFDSTGHLRPEDSANYLRFLAAGGLRVFMTTAGTSLFTLLSTEEIRELNAACLEAAQETGTVLIRGLPPLPDRLLMYEIDLANADDALILLVYPDRHYGDDHVARHFFRAADHSRNPVLIHAKPIPGPSGVPVPFGPSLMGRLAAYPNIMGMKEESPSLLDAFNLIESLPKGFTSIVAGSSIRRHMMLAPAGATTWLTGLGSIVPEAAVFAMRDPATILPMETDLFRAFMPMGWHKGLRTALSQMGLIRGNRNPFPKASRAEAATVRRVVKRLLAQWGNR